MIRKLVMKTLVLACAAIVAGAAAAPAARAACDDFYKAVYMPKHDSRYRIDGLLGGTGALALIVPYSAGAEITVPAGLIALVIGGVDSLAHRSAKKDAQLFETLLEQARSGRGPALEQLLAKVRQTDPRLTLKDVARALSAANASGQFCPVDQGGTLTKTKELTAEWFESHRSALDDRSSAKNVAGHATSADRLACGAQTSAN